MKKSITSIAVLTAIAGIFLSSTALAANTKHINKTMAIEQGQEIQFNVPVGGLQIKTCNCNDIAISIDIKGDKQQWSFFSRPTDIEEIELEIKQSKRRISFGIDEEGFQQEWTVTVPESSALDIQMGVGDIKVTDLNNDLSAEIGVGDIKVTSQNVDYRKMKISAGVGETSVHGFDGQVGNDRALVSSDTSYIGHGNYKIDIEVGVGGASVSK